MCRTRRTSWSSISTRTKWSATSPTRPGVHGIAIAPELNRGFISNGRGNNVTIFDLKTLKAIGTAATGENPDSIRYDAVSGRVFAFNGRSKSATAIDAKTGTVAGDDSAARQAGVLRGRRQGQGLRQHRGHQRDRRDRRCEGRPSRRSTALTGCEGPSGLAIDAKNRRLFSVCGNRVMAVSDPDAGKVVATPAIGAGSDGAAFDPGTGYAFSSNGDGTLTIVQQTGGKWDVLENIATERGARTIALDEKTHKVYVPTATAGQAAAGGRAPYLPDSFKVLVVGK